MVGEGEGGGNAVKVIASETGMEKPAKKRLSSLQPSNNQTFMMDCPVGSLVKVISYSR